MKNYKLALLGSALLACSLAFPALSQTTSIKVVKNAHGCTGNQVCITVGGVGNYVGWVGSYLYDGATGSTAIFTTNGAIAARVPYNGNTAYWIAQKNLPSGTQLCTYIEGNRGRGVPCETIG